MQNLYFVRHGESIRNEASAHAFQGDLALLQTQLLTGRNEAIWPLTDLGRAQARMAGEWLRENLTTEPILFSSPFTRAVQTAEILGLGVEIHLDDRLREREWGDYPLDQYGADRYMADLARCHIPDWKSEFPGSESIEDLVPSSRDFYRDSTETAGGRPVVAVTHGGRILALEIAVEGEITNRRLANCCILHYRIGSEGGAVRILYPAQPHLQPTDWTPIPNILSA